MSASITGMEQAIRVVGNSPDDVARKVMAAVDREVVIATPVDTGRARASWLPGVDSPEFETLPPGQYPTPGPKEWEKAQTGRYYLTNNLPYIVPLNEGHSQQAPAGFVEEAVARGVRNVK